MRLNQGSLPCGVLLTLMSLFASQSHASACNYTTYVGYDFNNGDLPNQPVSTVLSNIDECAALCCITSGCGAFTLNAGLPFQRACYLKAAVGWTLAKYAGSVSGCIGGTACVGPSPGLVFPWFNLTLPTSQRIDALISAMTLNETIDWLNDNAPAIARLNLPSVEWEAEALHGVAWSGAATVFPENIAWGATFNVPLIAAVADVIATEARAKSVAGAGLSGAGSYFSFMTPNNNLFLDPRWGRGQETYGEDPVLTSAMTSAIVRGLQEAPVGSPTSHYRRLLATSKHWLS